MVEMLKALGHRHGRRSEDGRVHFGQPLVRQGLADIDALQGGAQGGGVEDVVPQNHGAGVVADEFLPQQKGLGQSDRGGLDLVGQLEPVLAAVP